jgi:molybdopterin-guanine dinucleotide biosynthesis protein A/molybdopterin converting factor small subunit
MGRPKALLLFDGDPLILHIVRALQPLFVETVVVASADQELPPLPVTVVRDEVAYQGPVGGIYYGLKAASREVCFLTSCDAPFLNLSLVAYLVSRISDYDVVVPHWQGRFQPLHAVYRRSVMPLLKEQLEQGELRPIFLYDKVRTATVGEDEIHRFDPDGLSFLNMNTPDDYERALKLWQESRQRVRTETETAPHSLSVSSPCLTCTVELFGVARLRAKISEIALELPQDATLAHVFMALADRLPVLVGPVIAEDRNNLASGHACNINGRDFVRNSGSKVSSGDRIFIISADAGG